MRTVGMKAKWPVPSRTVRVAFALALLGAMVAAAALLIATAGSAHATPAGDTSGAFSGPAGDADSYAMWEDLAPFDSQMTPDLAGRFGQAVCNALAQGASEGRLINIGTAQYGVDFSAARYVVHAAEWHYCPSYY